MPRRVVRLPFVRGLERAASGFLLEPASFRYLSDVHVVDGAMRLRRGMETKGTIGASITDIIGVHPMRGAEQSVVVAYRSDTRDVSLWKAIVDETTMGVTLTSAGTLYTLPAGTAFPRVVIADSFGLAFIAHDEPTYGFRQATKVYDPAAGTITSLLYNNDGAYPMNLRGARRWLNYVVGWGYGKGIVGPPDQRSRPHWVRLSMPGDPTRWRPEYFLEAGQQDEPVTAGNAIAEGFIVAKAGELYRIVGTSQLDFDIVQVDQYFGAVAANAAIAVGGGFYFWSAEGPRVSTGGASQPIGGALDLFGELPSDLLASTDYRYTFTAYRPDTDEIEWVFPLSGHDRSWSFVYHRGSDSGAPFWHYNDYRRLFRSAGVLTGNSAADLSDPANFPVPIITAFTLDAGSWYKHSITWSNYNIGYLPASSVAEVWVSGGASAFGVATALPWSKVTELAAAGASQSVTAQPIGAADTGQVYRNVAVRYRLADGTYYPSYQSANPMDWPASSRGTMQASARPEIGNVLADWDGSSGLNETMNVDWDNDNVGSLDAGAVVEIWGMGADSLAGAPISPDTWQKETEVAASGASQSQGGLIIPQQARHLALRYRIGGKYYTHSSDTADPFGDWPLDSVDALVLDGPRPYPTFAWDVVNGIPRSPGTLTVAMPDNTLAPNGSWELEVWQTIWHSGIGYAITAIPANAWTELTALAPRLWTPQPPASQGYGSFSALNSSYKFLFACRLLYQGAPRPTSYNSSNPLDWPAISRITVDSL